MKLVENLISDLRRLFGELLKEKHYCVVVNPSEEQLKVNNPDFYGKLVDFSKRNITSLVSFKKKHFSIKKSRKTKKIVKSPKKNTVKRVLLWSKIAKEPGRYESLNWIFSGAESISRDGADLTGRFRGAELAETNAAVFGFSKVLFFHVIPTV